MCCSFIPDEFRDRPDLRLLFKREGQRTVLAESFARMPFRSFPAFYAGDHRCAYAYMVTSTPGFLGGDRVGVDLAVGPEAHAFVTGPSALKILRTGLDHAEQTTQIRIGDGAVLEYLPPYVIPFTGSRYRQKTTVRMERGASCLILDWFSTGRVRRGESLSFDEYDNATTILSADEPLVHDRFVLRPGNEEYGTPGRLESHTVSACLYLIHGSSDIPKALARAVSDTLLDDTILAGASTIDGGGLVVRVMGHTVPPVQKALVRVIGMVRRTLFSADDEGLVKRLLGVL